MISISNSISQRVSVLRDTIAAPNPEARFEHTSNAAASLAIASGFITLAWIALAPTDKRLITLGLAGGFFLLALVYLMLSKRWRRLPDTFGVVASLLASIGIWADYRSWTLGLIVYCMASMYAANFLSPRGLALQLAVASGSFLIVLIFAGVESRLIADWIGVTMALTFFALAVYSARYAVDRRVDELRKRAFSQQVVARLGQLALVEVDTQALMQEAAAGAVEALAIDRVVVLENVGGAGLLSMRASAGRLASAGEPDSALAPDAFSRYALSVGKPVVVTDLGRETRFNPPPALLELGIVSAVNVVIPGRDHTWGVLGARSVKRRTFSDAEIDFLRSLANGLGSAIELREHGESEQATRAETAALNERLSAVIDASPVAIIEVDRDRRVTVWNEIAERIFGWSSAEALGNVLPTVPDHLLGEFSQLVEKVSAGEQIVDFETERRRRDGSVFPYSVSLAAHRDGDGETVGVIGFGTDLSERRRIETALAKERDLLSTFLATTSDHVYFKDRASRFIKISASLARDASGLSGAEAIGKTDFDLFSEEHARAAYDDEQRIIRTGEPLLDIEEKETWEDGRIAWVSTSKMPLHDERGTITGTFGISRDITQRKLAEEARELYRVVVENSHDMIAVLDPMGRFIFTSPSYQEALGYTPEELVQVSPISLVHPADVQYASDALRRAMTSRDAAVVELRMRHKHGSWVFVEGSTTSVLDENGQLQTILMSFRDISERLAAAEELREAEARYRLLVEQLPLITYINILGESGRWVYLSPQLEEILGYQPTEWTSEYGKFVNAIHPEDRERVVAERAASVEKGRIGLEYRLLSKDERTVWIRDEAVVVRDPSGKPLYVQGYLLDISAERDAEAERERLEAELQHSQKMEAIGRLAGGIAHDFNNLLTAIIGYSELIVSELDPASSLARDTEEIKRAAEQAAAMTQQLLAFSRRQVLQPAMLSLNEVIETMKKMLERLIGENIELATKLEPEIAVIRSDRSQLEQVIMNLVVNARDAMPGGGTITIETANVSFDSSEAARAGLRAGDYVATTVSDTGCGMDGETMSHIFEPFFTTKVQGEGTGLGLSTVHGIVEQSNGAIQVQSEIGEGAVFNVYLPVAPERVEEAPANLPLRETGGSETLLLVEDEEMVRQLVARVLRDLGYEVFDTASGDEAISFSDSFDREIDLLLTDVVMPGMSGRELVEVLAAKRPTTRVLFMSGYTDEASVHHGVLDGVAEFIGKPFTPQELAHKIRSLLEASESADARKQPATG